MDETRTPDFPLLSNQKKSMGSDHELVELLWQNGQVVLNGQTHRRPYESKQVGKSDQQPKSGVSFGNSSNMVQDETVPWLQYPIDDSLEKEFFPFFYDIPTVDSIRSEGMSKEATSGENHVFLTSSAGRYAEDKMAPLKLQLINSTPPSNPDGGRIVNFSNFTLQTKAIQESSNERQEKLEDGSKVAIASSHCGSNQVHTEANMSRVSSNGVIAMEAFTGAVKNDVRNMILQSERGKTETLETTITSSCGGSAEMERMGNQTAINQLHKRKKRDADESECQSKEAEYESVEANKSAHRSTSTRRSRATEVHNLSERRRRDRINEKMKALQELIPHCNKSDKASMLDEAIEYLKSLQLQLQILWMGSGMAPLMFPSFQHYISGMGMGMGHAPLPSIHGPLQLPRVPLINQPISPVIAPNQPQICPSQALNVFNLQNQMQNTIIPDSYAQYPGIRCMQMVPQTTNLFAFGTDTMQRSQNMVPPSSSGGPYNSTLLPNNIQNSNLG